jgi:undecaprenyl-diphosphatase
MHDAVARGRVSMTAGRKWILLAVALLAMALFLGLGAATGSNPIGHFDGVVRGAVHGHASPSLTSAMLLATELGSTPVVTSVSVLSVFCFLAWQRNQAAVLLAVDMGVAVFLNTFLKDIFHRPRPDPFFGITAPHSFSYPNGHALFAVCCYGMLATLIAARVPNRWAKAGLLLAGGILAAAIGFSRVYRGVHCPSDVPGGWAFGTAWVCELLLFDKRVTTGR